MTNEGPGWALACSPDGTQIAVGGKNKIVDVWDSVQSRRLAQLRGHKAEIISLNYSRVSPQPVGTKRPVYGGHLAMINPCRCSLLKHQDNKNVPTVAVDFKEIAYRSSSSVNSQPEFRGIAASL